MLTLAALPVMWARAMMVGGGAGALAWRLAGPARRLLGFASFGVFDAVGAAQ
jgi:hypothetical protein